eukprot:835914_1
MNRIQWIGFIATLLIQFQCDAMRRAKRPHGAMIPVDFQREPVSTDQRSTINITNCINIEIHDLMDSLSAQRKKKSRTRTAHHAISERLNDTAFATFASLGMPTMNREMKELER